MKINELARLSGINPETIRSYRSKGLLHPVKQENGYYEYSAADYVSLAYIRKMRGYSFTIDDISRMYESQNPEFLLSVFDHEKEFLTAQIADLENKLRFLELERRHVMESSTINDVMIMQSIDEKIDFYELDYFLTNKHAYHRLGIYTMMTPTVWIDPEVLNGGYEGEFVPIRIGIGTYRYLLNDLKTEAPAGSIIIPNGVCVSQMLEVSDISRIRLEQIEPMISYARENHLRYLSGTTGYLMNIENRSGAQICHFRIRAVVEKNDYSAV
jgi:DNA-binding transcriptional MerR regulator